MKISEYLSVSSCWARPVPGRPPSRGSWRRSWASLTSSSTRTGTVRTGPRPPTTSSGANWTRRCPATAAGGWPTATTASPGTSSGPGRRRSSGWTTSSRSYSGGCGGAPGAAPCAGPSCGTATGRTSGSTSSRRTRSSCGYSRLTGRAASRYQAGVRAA